MMTIVGIGTDIVDIRRFAALLEEPGGRFLERTFTAAEIESARRYPKGSEQEAAHFAKRFAAKEACAKALGTGIGARALFTEIEVTNDRAGKPSLSLTGRARDTLGSLTPKGRQAELLLSLADEPPYAQAFVMIAVM